MELSTVKIKLEVPATTHESHRLWTTHKCSHIARLWITSKNDEPYSIKIEPKLNLCITG